MSSFIHFEPVQLKLTFSSLNLNYTSSLHLYVSRNDPAQYKNLKALITEDYTANNIPRNIKKELKWPFVLNLKDSFEGKLMVRVLNLGFGILICLNS